MVARSVIYLFFSKSVPPNPTLLCCDWLVVVASMHLCDILFWQEKYSNEFMVDECVQHKSFTHETKSQCSPNYICTKLTYFNCVFKKIIILVLITIWSRQQNHKSQWLKHAEYAGCASGIVMDTWVLVSAMFFSRHPATLAILQV